MEISIKTPNNEDFGAIYDLIYHLAVYERAPEEVTITVEKLIEDYKNQCFKIFLAERTDTKEIIGMSFYYDIYSTWKGRSLYLEDIIVKEEYRRLGVGAKLFEAVKEEFDKGDYSVWRWVVLDWNEPALKFYEKYNTVIDNSWLSAKIVKP
jgi:ribosomal protein S18 acetylase RimI-like enzyme